MFQMVRKYSNIFHSKNLKNIPKFVFFSIKINHLATLIGPTPMQRKKPVNPFFFHRSIKTELENPFFFVLSLNSLFPFKTNFEPIFCCRHFFALKILLRYQSNLWIFFLTHTKKYFKFDVTTQKQGCQIFLGTTYQNVQNIPK
jgi:hypothetical protein